MKVKDLIYILEDLHPDDEVYFLPANSCYPEDFSDESARKMEIRSFWGSDFSGYILKSDGQVGGV